MNAPILEGIKNADLLHPGRDLVRLSPEGEYRQVRRVELRTSEVLEVTIAEGDGDRSFLLPPWAPVCWMDREHAHSLNAEAQC